MDNKTKVPLIDKIFTRQKVIVFAAALGLVVFSLLTFFSLLMPGLHDSGATYSMNFVTFGGTSELGLTFQANVYLILAYFFVAVGAIFLLLRGNHFKFLIATLFDVAALVFFALTITFTQIKQGIEMKLTLAIGPIFNIIILGLSIIFGILMFVFARLTQKEKI